MDPFLTDHKLPNPRWRQISWDLVTIANDDFKRKEFAVNFGKKDSLGPDGLLASSTKQFKTKQNRCYKIPSRKKGRELLPNSCHDATFPMMWKPDRQDGPGQHAEQRCKAPEEDVSTSDPVASHKMNAPWPKEVRGSSDAEIQAAWTSCTSSLKKNHNHHVRSCQKGT